MVADNARKILDTVAEICLQVGRDPRGVTVLAAVKTVEPHRILELVGTGIDTIGENRVQEFVDKYPFVEGKFRQHFIGSLQTNKVKYLVGKVDLIHSVDRAELLREISARSQKQGVTTDILLEVNAGCEPNKSGVFPQELPDLAQAAIETQNVRVRGLMCVLPIDAPERLYADMQRLHADFNAAYDAPVLSMGMSNDYRTALKYGATLVRIGRGLFGDRAR